MPVFCLTACGLEGGVGVLIGEVDCARRVVVVVVVVRDGRMCVVGFISTRDGRRGAVARNRLVGRIFYGGFAGG